MRRPNVTTEWLIAAFMLGAVFFDYPILSLFNKEGSVLGIPVLYVYIFVAWGGLIGLAAWILRREH